MTNTVIVDTSIVLKWVLIEADSPKARALLTEWIKKQMDILAPALLAYEIANTLYQNVRKGAITLDNAKQALAKVLLSELKLDFSQDPSLSTRAIELTHEYGLLAAYDAHYLALAERENCDLWTADTRMWRTIKGQLSWVHCLDDYVIP